MPDQAQKAADLSIDRDDLEMAQDNIGKLGEKWIWLTFFPHSCALDEGVGSCGPLHLDQRCSLLIPSPSSLFPP